MQWLQERYIDTSIKDCAWYGAGVLSGTMHLLISLEESSTPQNRQPKIPLLEPGQAGRA